MNSNYMQSSEDNIYDKESMPQQYNNYQMQHLQQLKFMQHNQVWHPNLMQQSSIHALYNEQLIWRQQQQLQYMQEQMNTANQLLSEQHHQKVLNQLSNAGISSKCPSPTHHFSKSEEDISNSEENVINKGNIAPTSTPSNYYLDNPSDINNLQNELKKLLKVEPTSHSSSINNDDIPANESHTNHSSGSASSIQLGRDLDHLFEKAQNLTDDKSKILLDTKLSNDECSSESNNDNNPTVRRGRFKVTQVYTLHLL